MRDKRSTRRRVPRRLLVVVGVATLVAACTAPTSSRYYPPAHQTFSLKCEVTSNGTNPSYATITKGMTTVAPISVAVLEPFVVTFQMDPITTPSAGTAVQSTTVGWWTYRWPVPANTEFISVSLLAGSGYVGTPTATYDATGNYVQFSLNSWQPADTDIVFPTVLLSLRATSAPGSTVATTIYGTNYANWGFVSKKWDVIAGQNLFTTSACYPESPPLLSGTTVT